MKKEKKILLFIFLLALFLRIFKLSTFPFGFHADEVRVGWNAYSILKTGADDRGNILALYYNTFGDFRPTGIFYLTIPSLLIFGINEFAVRFPSAFFGALTIFPLFFLVKEFSKDKRVSFIAALLLSINPWHISTSRATSEVIISMFFALFGLYFFVNGLNLKDKKKIVLSFVFLFISYFFYHSIRVLAPMFLFAILVFEYFFGKTKKVLYKPAIIAFLVLCFCTLLFSLNKEARGRFSQVSIFNDLDVQYELSRMPFEEGPNRVFIARLFHNKPFTYTRKLINEYTKYFSSDFFLDSTTPKPQRYQTVGVGLFTYIELALLVAGLIAIAQKRASILPLLLLLIAPFPAALTTEDSPNLHRSLYMIPFALTIGAYGFNLIALKFKKIFEKTNKLICVALGLNLIFFLHMYFVHNKVHLPLYRNVGAKELALSLKDIQNEYDKIIITNIPDDPYPWIAFLTKMDPETFNKDAVKRSEGVWTHDNFVFTGQRCPSRDAFVNPDVEKLLVVDAEGCATESNLLGHPGIRIRDRILRPDESEVYILWDNIIQ